MVIFYLNNNFEFKLHRQHMSVFSRKEMGLDKVY